MFVHEYVARLLVSTGPRTVCTVAMMTPPYTSFLHAGGHRGESAILDGISPEAAVKDMPTSLMFRLTFCAVTTLSSMTLAERFVCVLSFWPLPHERP